MNIYILPGCEPAALTNTGDLGSSSPLATQTYGLGTVMYIRAVAKSLIGACGYQ